ncbi:MAG: hypothetical protein IJT94_15800 [Oscillibacter sp.]|nr:hypothetical protein [Oscillibacter sp.]
MEKAFELFIADEGENHSEAWAKLLLPASPCELLDAVERAQVTAERPVYLEIQKYALGMEGLKPYIGVERNLSALYAFNALAEKLVTLDDTQRLVLAECLRDEENGGPVPLPRIYDLAAGDEAFQCLDLTPPEPDYTALLELWTGQRADAKPVTLKLPVTLEEIGAVRETVGAGSLSEIEYRCLDCLVPALIKPMTAAKELLLVNTAAHMLTSTPKERLTRYKALLEAMGFMPLWDALNLFDTLDEYTLEPDIRCPEDAGRKELHLIISSPEVEKVLPHVNLLTYGQQTLEQYHMVLTGYGGFCRVDGKPFRKRPCPDSGNPDSGGIT